MLTKHQAIVVCYSEQWFSEDPCIDPDSLVSPNIDPFCQRDKVIAKAYLCSTRI